MPPEIKMVPAEPSSGSPSLNLALLLPQCLNSEISYRLQSTVYSLPSTV